LSFAFLGYGPFVGIGFTEEPTSPPVLDGYLLTVAERAAVLVAICLAKLTDAELNITRLNNAVEQGVGISQTIVDEALRLCGVRPVQLKRPERSQRKSCGPCSPL
jgi:hypothetical protein